MKKIIYFCFLTILCIMLCACDPGEFRMSHENLNNVTSIELINYKNIKQKHFIIWALNHYDKLLPFENKYVTVIETLPESKINEFLSFFKETDILNKYYAYNSPSNICIRINYSNGNFLIIWANHKIKSHSGYIGEYAPDGTVLSFWGSFSGFCYFEDLINNFFVYEI